MLTRFDNPTFGQMIARAPLRMVGTPTTLSQLQAFRTAEEKALGGAAEMRQMCRSRLVAGPIWQGGWGIPRMFDRGLISRVLVTCESRRHFSTDGLDAVGSHDIIEWKLLERAKLS